jgi:hypothetical protein
MNEYVEQYKIIKNLLFLRDKKPKSIMVSEAFKQGHGKKFDGIELISVDTDNYFHIEFVEDTIKENNVATGHTKSK